MKENERTADEKIIIAFINGEWCDTDDICRLLKISFADGLRCFDFSRTAEWNAAPLEGQKITTKFRIKAEKEETPSDWTKNKACRDAVLKTFGGES